MSNNGIIKNTVIDVAQRVIKQESKTNKKLDNILNKKFEKADQDKARYIDILKYNVLFYKTLSRNMEPLIGKWILEKNIPDLSELQDDIELMNARCRKYINNAKANGIDGLKEADVQSFTYYDRMNSGDCIKRLQKDYKVLNIYIEVLSMTLKELSYKREESVEIFLMNPSEAKMELKREIIVIVNRILAGGSKENEETPIDEAYIKRIKMITDAEITEASNDELKRILELENLSAEEAFGVSSKYAYIFAAATVLLEFVKDKKRAVIEGAMRLTISGEFGEENFTRFMGKALNKKSIIEPETWKEAVRYLINEKACIESTDIAMLDRTVTADINEDDYVYALENEDQEKPLRNKMNRKIEPSMIIPGVITKAKEEAAKKEAAEKEAAEKEAAERKAAEEEAAKKEAEVKADEYNQEDNAEETAADDISDEEALEENSEADEEAERALNRRKEQLIEREKIEKEREEERQKKFEEEEKKKDPVERAKKGIEELKKELEGDLEEPSYDDNSEEEKSDLEIISDIVGLKDEMEDDEEEEETVSEEEPKKTGFSLFGSGKNKKAEEEQEEESDSEEEEEEEYEEDPEKIKEYEKKVKEIKQKKAEDKKKRRKLDMIIAILIVAVAAGGYGLTVKRQKQQERIKQEQIKQEQQEQARKEAEEKRKEEEKKKIAEEESARLAEMEKVKNDGEYYKVYAGAFKEQDKAKSLITNLDKKGFKGELVHIGDYYKAVVGGDIGAYPEAEKQMKALKSKGFDSYIEKYDKYCDLKIEDFRLRAEYMSKGDIEKAYKDLNNELKKRKNYEDYSKILERTYNELMENK